MSDANDIRDGFGERLWKTPKEIREETDWRQDAAELLAFIKKSKPMNVRPEFMDAAEKFLAEWEPSTNWKETCLCLTVAAFGQRCFELAENGGERALREYFEK